MTGLRRTTPLQRRTGLARSSELARGAGPKRTGRLAAKRKPPEQLAIEETVRGEVFARDGGCLMANIEPDRCYGRLTFHHLEKDGQGGTYTADNGACLCVFHNDDVEDHPRRYRLLGLVVHPGITHDEAAERRAAAGLTPRSNHAP